MTEARNPFRGVKIFFLGYFVLLILALTFVGIMGWLGYEPANATAVHGLFVLLVCSALIAGSVALVNRAVQKWTKMVIGSLCGLVVLVVGAGLMMLFSVMMLYAVPVYYTTLTSPSGQEAVVVQRLSQNMDAAQIRREARMASGSEDSDEEYAESDLAYQYLVYPETAKFFYNTKCPAEGYLEIGCRSEAQLMYEWTDDNTLHMYIDNPQDQDFGELTLKFD